MRNESPNYWFFIHHSSFLITNSLSHQECKTVYILQSNACSSRHAQQWIFSDMERYINLISQTLVQSTKQSTTTCQIDTIFYNVGIQFRWCLFQSTQYSCFNLCNALFLAMCNFLIVHRYFHWKGCNTVRTAYNVIFRSIITQIS